MKKFFILLLKPLSFIPALCMMYFIFSFSGQSGEQSGALSQKISREIVVVADKALDKNLDETRIQYYTDKLEFPVRKAASCNVSSTLIQYLLVFYYFKNIHWTGFCTNSTSDTFACNR